MTRKPKTIAFWHGRLPHWEVADGRYFITIHLSGAIPREGRERLRKISADLAREHRDAPQWITLQRMIFQEMECWLDHSRWSPHFSIADVAKMAVDAIEHRNDRGDWRTLSYVVMPTHLHLFCELGPRGLKTTVEDFKRWTGHHGAKLLPVTAADSFWQREWFDHWSRSDAEDERIVAYIRNNPVKAGLVSDHQQWPYGSW
jgi:REP-associated tyrosine transposase